MEDDTSDTEPQNVGKSATVQCVQYLILHHMKNKSVIRKDDLMKNVFKGRVIGKNYNIVIQDVENTLKNVFGLTISLIKEDYKQFIIVNNIEKVKIPVTNLVDELSKYRCLYKPIIIMLIMLRQPISEGQMWNIMEEFSIEYNLDINLIKNIVKKDFVRDQYLLYKPTDDSTIMFDPEKTSYWFSLGPRAIVECDQMKGLQKVAELYNKPVKSFKRVYAAVNK